MRFALVYLAVIHFGSTYGFNDLLGIEKSAIVYDLSKNDSLRDYSSLPKNQLYVQYYNPIYFLQIKEIGNFNIEFSRKRKTNKYFTLGAHHMYDRELVDTSNLYTGLSFQYIHFRHMHHFLSKRDWFHFEIDYGVMVGRHYYSNHLLGYRFNKEFYGDGIATAFEAQFQVGNWGNISLRSDITYMLGQRESSFSTTLEPDVIIDKYYEFWQLPTIWLLNVGFNFYV